MEVHHCRGIEQPDAVRTYSAMWSEDGNKGVGLDHHPCLHLYGEPLRR